MVDEFGLAYELYRNVSPLGRRYIAHALETLGYSKLISPSQQSPATIPELVVYGGLLLRGFRDFSGPDGGGRGAGPKGFVFRQVHGSKMLGRIAEVDFTLYLGMSVTAVMVDGAFHSADHPAGLGGAAMVKDRRQWQGLLALLDITRVLSVNRYWCRTSFRGCWAVAHNDWF
jgi:hypothetical protein